MATKIKTKIVNLMLVIAILLTLPVSAYAQDDVITVDDIFRLSSISFKNATLDQEFDPNKLNYTITLDDPNINPTLEKYEIDGNAKIFITYEHNSAGKQSGIKATLKSSNAQIYYIFNYSNPPQAEISSNNNLNYVGCELCTVYPELNSKDTNYTIYIPNDLTEVRLSVATEDPNATVQNIASFSLGQDTKKGAYPPVKVIASDSSVKIYNFKLVRLDLTSEEIMNNPNSDEIINDQINHNKTMILLIVLCVILGVIALVLFAIIAKKVTVKVVDEDDVDFFDELVTEDESEAKEE